MSRLWNLESNPSLMLKAASTGRQGAREENDRLISVAKSCTFLLYCMRKERHFGSHQASMSESQQLGQTSLSGVTHNHWHMGIQNTWMGAQQTSPGIGLQPFTPELIPKSTSHQTILKCVNTWICMWMHTRLLFRALFFKFFVVFQQSVCIWISSS